MLKRARFYYRNPCSACEEAMTFLEEHGVLVDARELNKNPLSKDEIKGIFRYFDAKHFIDPATPAYKKAKLDKKMPPREELYGLMEEHPELIRNPVIVRGRLMTIGAGRKQLIDMFQLTVSDNGSKREEERDKRKEIADNGAK